MLLGGLDVGTFGCKLSIYRDDGTFIENFYREYDVSRNNGAHEIDASVIWDAVLALFRSAAVHDLAAVGVTSFGESFVLLDENDNVLLPSMLYTDPRGTEECGLLKEALGEDTLIRIAGVKPHSMYSLAKLMWVKRHHPEIWARVRRILLIQHKGPDGKFKSVWRALGLPEDANKAKVNKA